MARIQGNLLAVRLAYLDERATSEQRDAILAAVPPATSEALLGKIDPSGWYPFRHLVELNGAIARTIGPDETSALYAVGRYAAEVALADLRDTLVKQRSPNFMFRQAPTIWHQHYDSGNVRVTEMSETSGTFLIEDFDDPAREHCAAVQGWIQATIELTGVDDVRVVERRCRCRGDERCEFECHWSVETSAG